MAGVRPPAVWTGSRWEGGTEVGDVDVGYGPARAFTSDQLQTIAEALAQISTADLLARYDGSAMQELYPGGWKQPPERNGNLKYLAFHFDALKHFIGRATEERLGIIAYAN